MQKSNESTQASLQSHKQYSEVSNWIHSIAIVKFDIDQGQKIDLLIPKMEIQHEQQKQIAMLAFPDSNSLSEYQGTFKYIFKLNNGCFGYTCFKQKKDPLNPRGYSQKSLVILSSLPLINFFLKMAQFIVFKVFKQNQNAQQNLWKVISQIQKWPQPTPLKRFILPILDYELQIDIPNYIVKQYIKVDPHNISLDLDHSKQFSLQEIVSKQSLKMAGKFQQIKLSQVFMNCYESLWYLWEGIILNKAIMIMGQNPYQVSQAVLGAISLINPIVYEGAYSPYVTVFDSNLKLYQQKYTNFIIGGTNPLFHKLFANKNIQVIDLRKKKQQKHQTRIRPMKQLFLPGKTQQQHAINQSALRKYFFKINRSIISSIEQYVNLQKNDLKFFNQKQFMQFLKNKKTIEGLQHLYDKKKYLLLFFQKFIKTTNFKNFLKSRNINITSNSNINPVTVQ